MSAKKQEKTRRVVAPPPSGGAAGGDPMTRVLPTFRRPGTTDFDNAWVGLEPTFQSEKSVKKWHKLAAEPGGEDAYFLDEYMLGTQEEIAKAIKKKYESKRAEGGHAWCMFDDVDRKEDIDQWKVKRQNLVFQWKDRSLENFTVRFSLDPETFEYSVKPVPLAWFYDERFVKLLDELLWEVPMKHGLAASIAHGGAQFSCSAKTFLTGSLLADDIATRLNHPELSTWTMDWPNPDDRAFRATRRRFAAFRAALDAYWAGGFHPRANGVLTFENAFLDRGFGPAPNPPSGLMDAKKGPEGDPREVFQTNFAFGRAVRLSAQNVHPGYWQSAHPHEEGYRPDQIMRYSEGNLNRLQLAGEVHVKSGKVLQPERAPELDAPLDISMLTNEASWEDRAQMGRTSARDFVEALLLDAHHARWLVAHPHVQVKASLLQDQLHGDAEDTVRRHAGEAALGRLRAEARKANLESSQGRIKSDWVEPETLFWEAWRALPAGERAAIAREAVAGFVERVEQAASADPRPQSKGADPMEWHRHRVHPVLWEALAPEIAKAKPGDPVRREYDAWRTRRDDYLARRPIFSHAGTAPPWALGD
ncbi:MAG: hypothetical protein HYZ53_18205 [Planctomycetes bacterium]|nr:hypothetical protein [Planctomycetota bacterium]